MEDTPVPTSPFDPKDRAGAITALHMMLEDGPTSFIPSDGQVLVMADGLEACGWPDLAALCRAWVAGTDYSWPEG